MDVPSEGIGRDQTEEPEHDQDHKDRPQHRRVLLTESLQQTYEGATILGDVAREVNEGLCDHAEPTHRPSKHVRPSQGCQAPQHGHDVCHVRHREG
jgi:hypothetical protein